MPLQAEHLDHQVRHQVGYRLPWDVTLGQSGPRHKGHVGNTHQAGRQAEHTICSGDDAQIVLFHERQQKARQADGQIGLIKPHDFLHQYPIHQLKQTILLGFECYYILR
jgi:hypothetical protein